MRNTILLILLILLFCLTELTLTHFLPLAKTNFEVWLKYFIIKDAVYDTMFFMFFLLTYWNVKSINLKAITAFGIIVSGGSFIDKVIFDLNQYLLSDILLLIIALVCSIYLKYRGGRFKNMDI